MAEETKVLFRVDTEEAKAVAGFLKLVDKQRAVEDQSERVSKSLKAQGKAGEDAAQSLMSIAKAGAGLLGVGSLIGTVTALLEKLDARATALAEKSRESAVGLREFLLLQPPGAGGRDFVRDVVMRGAKEFGLQPDQSGQIAQPLQSLIGGPVDTFSKKLVFDSGFDTAAKLVAQGVDAETAVGVVKSGKAMGKYGSEVGDIFMAAADASSLGPRELGTALPNALAYSNIEEALAQIASLTNEETNAGKIPALTEQLGRVIGRGTEGEGIQKRFKLGGRGLSESEKLEELYKIAQVEGEGANEAERVKDFTSRLKQYDVSSSEEAKALGIAIRQVPFTRETLAKFDSSRGNLDSKMGMIPADPLLDNEMLQRKTEAMMSVYNTYSDEAARARESEAKKRGLGLELVGSGSGFLADPNTASVGWFGSAMVNQARSMSFLGDVANPNFGDAPAYTPSKLPPPPPQSGAEYQASGNDEIVSLLREQNSLSGQVMEKVFRADEQFLTAIKDLNAIVGQFFAEVSADNKARRAKSPLNIQNPARADWLRNGPNGS
ncbi:MAG: hypothetical protein HYV27_15330 [Candidatus Hydrogenedentes bacterium]|nr:hypothetical protein [Candidatus Hydrogenedentota bacterium]